MDELLANPEKLAVRHANFCDSAFRYRDNFGSVYLPIGWSNFCVDDVTAKHA